MKPGDAYFVVLPSGCHRAHLSPSQGRHRRFRLCPRLSGSIPGLSAGVDGSDIVGGLTVGTTYDVYFAAEDLEGNLQAAPQLVTSAPAAAVDQFATGAFTWGTDSALVERHGRPLHRIHGETGTTRCLKAGPAWSLSLPAPSSTTSRSTRTT